MNIPSSVITNVENRRKCDMVILNKMRKACCRNTLQIFQILEEKEYNAIFISGRDITAENIMEDRDTES